MPVRLSGKVCLGREYVRAVAASHACRRTANLANHAHGDIWSSPCAAGPHDAAAGAARRRQDDAAERARGQAALQQRAAGALQFFAAQLQCGSQPSIQHTPCHAAHLLPVVSQFSQSMLLFQPPKAAIVLWKFHAHCVQSVIRRTRLLRPTMLRRPPEACTLGRRCAATLPTTAAACTSLCPSARPPTSHRCADAALPPPVLSLRLSAGCSLRDDRTSQVPVV